MHYKAQEWKNWVKWTHEISILLENSSRTQKEENIILIGNKWAEKGLESSKC